MAGPVLLGGLSLGLGTLGTLQRLRASKKDERIQASITNFNARVAQQNAELALKAYEKKAEDIRANTRELISSHRAAFGASNLVTTSGSPLLAQLKQAEVGEEIAQDVLLEGRLQAQGFSTQAELDRFQSETIRARARSQRQKILLSGISRGVGRAASLTGQGAEQ